MSSDNDKNKAKEEKSLGGGEDEPHSDEEDLEGEEFGDEDKEGIKDSEGETSSEEDEDLEGEEADEGETSSEEDEDLEGEEADEGETSSEEDEDLEGEEADEGETSSEEDEDLEGDGEVKGEKSGEEDEEVEEEEPSSGSEEVEGEEPGEGDEKVEGEEPGKGDEKVEGEKPREEDRGIEEDESYKSWKRYEKERTERMDVKLKCFRENFDNGRLNPKVIDKIMFDESNEKRWWELRCRKEYGFRHPKDDIMFQYIQYVDWRASLHKKMGVNGWTDEEIIEIEEKCYEFQYKKYRKNLNWTVRDGQIKFNDNLREEEYWQMKVNEEMNKSKYHRNYDWLYDTYTYVYYASGREILSIEDAITAEKFNKSKFQYYRM